MPFSNEVVVVEQDDIDRTLGFWRLVEPLLYEGKDEMFVVPTNFATDYATVPQFLQWLVPRTGEWNRAVIVHDYFCEALEEPQFYEDRRTPNARDTDGIFRRILREEGVGWAKRWLMWTGVRWGAAFTKSRRAGIAKDLPLMSILSLFFLPVLLPATAGITVGNAVFEAYVLTSEAGSWLRKRLSPAVPGTA